MKRREFDMRKETRTKLLKYIVMTLFAAFIAAIINFVFWRGEFEETNAYNMNFHRINSMNEIKESYADFGINLIYTNELELLRRHLYDKRGGFQDSIDYHYMIESELRELNPYGYEKSIDLAPSTTRLINNLELSKLYFKNDDYDIKIDSIISEINGIGFDKTLDLYAQDLIINYGVEEKVIYPNYPDELRPMNYDSRELMIFTEYYLDNIINTLDGMFELEIDI